MSRLAIVGSGIAGLGLAYYLRDQFEITIYEKDTRVGGHTNTVAVPEGGVDIPIDTGFMVFNHETYPNLIRLFAELKVPTKKTDMSFSVQHVPRHLEFAGASFNRLFGDRKNLLNLSFWSMLRQLDRFNKEGTQALLDPACAAMSLLEYVRKRNYGDDFLNCYLVPMSSALWSTAPDKILNFPAKTLLRFFQNHGLLGVTTQHQWWTVEGGAREYVKRLLATLPSEPRLRKAVNKVKRSARGVQLSTTDGDCETYDKVVLACHADQALAVLDQPTEKEKCLLSGFSYQRNETLLHMDSSVMPNQRRCWASWNYRLDSHGASTHYWMNSLQDVSRKKNFFVTLNGEHLVNQDKVLRRMTYHHPLFDLNAIEAQEKLPELNASAYKEQVYFCGSYFGYGFHEDALTSSLNLAKQLMGNAVCL
jgi:predicted NAD/FAD-binding protein